MGIDAQAKKPLKNNKTMQTAALSFIIGDSAPYEVLYAYLMQCKYFDVLALLKMVAPLSFDKTHILNDFSQLKTAITPNEFAVFGKGVAGLISGQEVQHALFESGVPGHFGVLLNAYFGMGFQNIAEIDAKVRAKHGVLASVDQMQFDGIAQEIVELQL